MMRTLWALLLTAVPSVAVAQTPDIQAKVNADLDTIRKAERIEDVEIMRRILNKSLGLGGKVDASCTVCHVFPGVDLMQQLPHFQDRRQPATQPPTAWYFPTTQDTVWGHARDITHVAPLPLFDAVYLAGHGAVYTLKIPASAGVVLDPVNKTAGLIETCLKCHTSMAKPDATPTQAKAPTEWDRARDEVRGVKPSTEVQPAVKVQPICEPGKLTERIVEKLWANAKNVRHLPGGEHLTIAITFDGHMGSSRFGSWSNWLGMPANPTVGSPSSSAIDFATETTGDNIAGFTAEEANAIRDARKSVATGRPAEAVKQYLNGLERVNFNGPVYVSSEKLTLWRQRFPKIPGNITTEVTNIRRELSVAAAAAGDTTAAKAYAGGALSVVLEPITNDPQQPKQPRVPERIGFTPEEVRLLTLGDLHLKQGKPKEAADAYEQALARYKNRTTKVDPPSNLTQAQLQSLVTELQSGVRGAFKQLAQAYLAAGDTEKASAALELARTFTAELPSRVEQARKGVAVPAKLVISITRSDAEKATTEAAFRKAVKVEVTGFPAADKPKQP